jgi:hypothetical protein
MAENKQLVVYAAAYETVDAALADLDAIEQLHKDEIIGQYDAAVIDQENGKPRVVKRMDRPHIRVIPEWFGGRTLPRKELHEAAEQLTASQAGLIAPVGPTLRCSSGAHSPVPQPTSRTVSPGRTGSDATSSSRH